MSFGGVFSALDSISTTVPLTLAMIGFTGMAVIVKISGLPLFQAIKAFANWVMGLFSKSIRKREAAYHRDLEIGKINEKRTRVKLYRFLNDLIIDLGLINYGMTSYELLYITVIVTTVVTLVLCKLVLNSFIISIIMAPIMIIAVFCTMYTKANLAHDARIEAVIEAENIICNNIKGGVVSAVRDSLNVLPKGVRPDFKDFLDNIEFKNYHVKTALEELNMRLGGIADDFIKKCIVFEIEEEHGISGMFSDIVEVNNIRMSLRIEMKRQFEEVMRSFEIGAFMIFMFLGGVLVIYPDIRKFYFTTFIGNLLLSIDVLLLIIEFVYITYLRAQEL